MTTVNITFQGRDWHPDNLGRDEFSVTVAGFDLDYGSITVYTNTDDGINLVLATKLESRKFVNENGDECSALGWIIDPETELLDRTPELEQYRGWTFARVIVTAGGFAVDNIRPPHVDAQVAMPPPEIIDGVAHYGRHSTQAKDKPCIRRTFQGGQEVIGLDHFVISAIQDDIAAVEVVRSMLDGVDPYTWNEDEPEFFETFEVVDADELRRQLAALELEIA